jgi:hypothetical protein
VRKKKEPELDEEGNVIIKPKKERKRKAPELDDAGIEIVKPKRVRKKQEPRPENLQSRKIERNVSRCKRSVFSHFRK